MGGSVLLVEWLVQHPYNASPPIKVKDSEKAAKYAAKATGNEKNARENALNTARLESENKNLATKRSFLESDKQELQRQ